MKLKRILSILAILCVVVTFAANTQRVLKIYSHNEVIGSFPIAVIDSIKIDKSTPSDKLIKIYQNNEISDFSIANIDSVKIEEEIEINPEDVPDNEIWYTTTDGNPIDLKDVETCFDVNIKSHIYENGKGVIMFDGVITKIEGSSFSWQQLKSIYLPHKITRIGDSAFFYSQYLESVYLPDDLTSVGTQAFDHCYNLSLFSGNNVSEDGRCVIINGELHAFASHSIKNYEFTGNIKIIRDYVCKSARCLETITLSEGIERIGNGAFEDCVNLKTVKLPLSLASIGFYPFMGCSALSGFYGNSKFHTDDNRCLLSYENESHSGPWLVCFAGAGITAYTIPERVKCIENYAFTNLEELRSITIPASVDIDFVGSVSFYKCDNIETIYGPYSSTDNKALVNEDEFIRLVAKKNLTTYHIPDNIKRIGSGSFEYLNGIENITMGDQVTHIGGYAFGQMPDLKSITLSANLQQIADKKVSHSGNIFQLSSSLETIYFRSKIPPFYKYPESIPLIPENSYPHLTIYVPQGTLNAYKNSDWYPFAQFMQEYEYTDLPKNDTYISSDYSQNGIVTTLQTATKGDGIDIVLMGDAYSDRQIADSTYEKDMLNLYNNLFTEEPYKSFKDHFNVYYVNVVSATEGYEYGNTTLGGYFGDGTLVGGNDNIVFTYAQKAISDERMDEAMIVVAMNSDNYAGTCYMYYPEENAGYGNGVSVSYFPKGGDEETFAQLLHHEACGHGFAKLADEYAYEDMGAAPSDYILQTQDQQNAWGWYKNVDFTSDLSQIRWAHFLNDSRYQYDGLGAFEGGLTYWRGVWRPTENSIMLYNTGGFNAPSREAIYYRIHKLAYGDDWVYNYEDFVKYDEINRKTAATSTGLKSIPEVKKDFVPLHEPVIVKKSWREAK